jgi:hypothetical protein
LKLIAAAVSSLTWITWLEAIEIAGLGIRQQYPVHRRLTNQMPNPKIVIADLDGTIALIEHRRHWLDSDQHPDLTSDERWRSFFAGCVDDEPNNPVINTLQALRDVGYEIHIFSGRSDEVHRETVKWLENFDIPYQHLRMRHAGDFTPDEELKRQWITEYDLAQIMCVFDDRPKVIRMWKELGLFVFNCGDGDEF